MNDIFGVGRAGAIGASVVLAGGVAYLVWTYASSSRRRKPEKRGQDKEGEDIRKGGKKEEEEQVVAAPVVAVTVQQTSEVRRGFRQTVHEPQQLKELKKIKIS